MTDQRAPETPTDPTARLDELRTRTASAFAGIRTDLEALVRIPSVSNAAFDQAHVRSSADAVADLLRGAGLDEVDVLTVTTADGRTGAPAV
ncbi:dipeptidase, partial [Cellulomonas septica]|nr:dipeptidase [Cellulomonas septica]